MSLAIVPLRLAWNCVKAYVVSPSHLLCWIWQASLVLGRVSVCGKPIVSISTYQSEIIDFTWLEAHPQLQMYLPRPRRKSLAVSKNDPLTCLGFWKKFTEQSGVHGSMSVHSRMSHTRSGVWNGYLARHKYERSCIPCRVGV